MSRYLDVDVSDAKRLVGVLREVHSQDEIEKMMYRALRRTGNHVRKILKTELPKEYNVKPGWIDSQLGSPRISMGGKDINCTIPIRGERGTIGGSGKFNAQHGAHGWNSLNRKYRVTAQILKGKRSTLPPEMSHQGGHPPFRNLGSKLGGATFTRKTDARLPIAKVAGIGVPQMPLNRSRGDVESEIVAFLEKRLAAEHNYIISRCR